MSLTFTKMLFMFQSLNIRMFVISVASSFLTISWNGSQSTNKDLILTVVKLDPNMELTKDKLTFTKLDVGHKSNSYTISELTPSSHYELTMFLHRNNHSVQVSSLLVTTKSQDFIKEQGIKKNYTAIVMLSLIGTALCSLCCAVLVCRVFSLRNMSFSQLTASSSNILLDSPSVNSSARSSSR